MTVETSTPRRKLSAILMVDVSEFSRMMGRDEEGTTARIREFHARVQSIVESHEGRVVDTAGDSVFGEFDSVVNAVRCAQNIQDTLAIENGARPPEEHIETRIGVHLGDVIVQDYHVYGDGVNIAARLQSLAEPGSICVSEAVYQQVFQKVDLAFEDLGVRKLKNIEHPIRLYRAVPGTPGETAREPKNLPKSDEIPEPPPSSCSWTEALLARGGLIPLVLGICLLAVPSRLFPFSTPTERGVAPVAGALLIALGLGNILARRTGRRGYRTVAFGVGIALCAAFARWRLPAWPFLIGGLIVVLRGLRMLTSSGIASEKSDVRRAGRRPRHSH